ncbi:MAG: hypothetical protein K0U38_00210 [Epsilonproteobacteria bacterium]|nr:hypothetical protein [Campylobacterota bacterium]
MKKTILALSMVGITGFIGCGGGSEEAKELLQRLLKIVGIPHNIVTTVCQDSNSNGICEALEPQATITITQGDSVSSIWQKITQSKEGEYLLETYDPALPLLLVLQDADSVHYDEGTFTLNYNGLQETQTEKELSILESMIDANHLTTQNVSAAREMKNVDDFYAVLLRDLEANINTLRAKGLTATQTMAGNIQEMAEELLSNGIEKTFPDSMNACNGNQTCVDALLGTLSTELLITDAEAEEIKQKQQETQEDETPVTTTQNKLDFSDYMVKSSTTKEYMEYHKYLNYDETTSTNREEVQVNGNILTYTHYYGTSNESSSTTTVTINDTTINSKSNDNEHSQEIVMTRYVDIGDTLWTWSHSDSSETYSYTSSQVCTADEQFTNFSHGSYSYSGDILKVKCITESTNTSTYDGETQTYNSKDIYYLYFKKDSGNIADINENCYNEQGSTYDSEGCTSNGYSYEYYLEN